MVTRGWNGYRNKSQHRKSTLEKKILPPFQQGFEPATFQSRVRCSNHWAIPAPTPLWKVNPFYLSVGQPHDCNPRPDNSTMLFQLKIRPSGPSFPSTLRDSSWTLQHGGLLASLKIRSFLLSKYSARQQLNSSTWRSARLTKNPLFPSVRVLCERAAELFNMAECLPHSDQQTL